MVHGRGCRAYLLLLLLMAILVLVLATAEGRRLIDEDDFTGKDGDSPDTSR